MTDSTNQNMNDKLLWDYIDAIMEGEDPAQSQSDPEVAALQEVARRMHQMNSAYPGASKPVNAKRVEIMQAYREQKASKSAASRSGFAGLFRGNSIRWTVAAAVAVIAGFASYYLISGGVSGGGMAGAAGTNAILTPLGIVVFVFALVWFFFMREKK
jgi:hypothetical protein